MTSRPIAALVVLVVALSATGVVVQAGAYVPSQTDVQQTDLTTGPAQLTSPSDGGESFRVVSVSAPDSAAPNTTVTVSALIENPNPDATAQSVEFRLEGDVVDRKHVVIDGVDSQMVTFTVDTAGVEPGDYLHSVFTEADGMTQQITISESFTVSNLSAPANATAGDEITVNATVTNPNSFTTTQAVEFRFAGALVASMDLTIDAENSTEFSVDADTSGAEAGTYAHGVFTRDSGQLALINVEAAPPAEPPAQNASVTFEDQDSDGTTVTVDSVTAPEGGFVVIHDDSLLDGNVAGSVIGVSEPLANGTSENVSVTLFDVPGADFNETELTENATLIAMPHMDTNGNGTYDFVTSNGSEDGPYTADGEAVVDAANVTVENETGPPEEPPANETESMATATFSDQTTDGTTVTVDSVNLSEGGYLAIHDDSLLEGNVVGSVIGVSEQLEAGMSENVSVTLFDVPGADFNETELMENATLIAMPHMETSNNSAYDFVMTGGAQDGPYTADGEAVVATANVTVENETGPSEEPPANETESMATVSFSDQATNGTTVTVDSVNLSEGGFVVIHDDSLLDGNVVGSVIGVSEPLANGTSENVSVTLFDVPSAEFNETELTENATLIAMPHMDTNGNGTYDFVMTDGAQDGPYTADGEAVVATANVTVNATTEEAATNETST